jgi:uncharacterized protein (TIGR02246 family)
VNLSEIVRLPKRKLESRPGGHFMSIYVRGLFSFLTIVLLMTGMLAAIAVYADENDRLADEQQIRMIFAAYEEAVNRRDLEGMVVHLAADFDLIAYGRPRAVGAESIRAGAQAAFSSWPAGMRLSLGVASVRFIGPGTAIAELEAMMSEGDSGPIRGTSVLVRRDGRWLESARRTYLPADT